MTKPALFSKIPSLLWFIEKKRVVYIRNVEFQLTIKRQLQSHFLVVFCSPSCPLNLRKVNSRDNNWRSNIDSERVALTMIPTRKAKFGA